MESDVMTEGIKSYGARPSAVDFLLRSLRRSDIENGWHAPAFKGPDGCSMPVFLAYQQQSTTVSGSDMPLGYPLHLLHLSLTRVMLGVIGV